MAGKLAEVVEHEGEGIGKNSRQKYSIFDDLSIMMKGLRLVSCINAGIVEEIVQPEQVDIASSDELEINLTVPSKKFCSTCGIEFNDRNEQVVHFGSDWHRFNLKRKVFSGLAALTREKFEELADDLSSISGSDISTSDSDSDDDDSHRTEMTSHRLPFVYFRNEEGDILSMYRCLLVNKKNSGDVDLTTVASRVGENRYWAVLMIGGGHFAAAIFDKTELLVHKTFHRYTVRAKRGTSQGQHDQRGTFAKSAGSSLRRYNEAQLVQNVQDLLLSWRPQLDLCTHVFLRAPSYNKAIFFSHKNPPLEKADARIRMIPFATRRPTMSELKRVQSILATVMNHGASLPTDDASTRSSPLKSQNRAKTKAKKEKDAEEATVIPSKGQQQPSCGETTESESESEGEVEYVTREEVHDKRHLGDFEATRKPRRRKKKVKAKAKVDPPVDATTEMLVEQLNLTDEDKKRCDDVYTACKTGNLKLLEKLVSRQRQNTSQNESEEETPSSRLEDFAGGVSLLEDDQGTINGVNKGCHTVKNNSDEVESLPDEIMALRFGAKRETMLHVTSRADWPEMTYCLLRMGVDPSIKDCVGLVPYAVCKSKATRNSFRRFMAAYPDRYDYVTAQVPSPLTDNMEEGRKSRENERKKLAKQAKRERQKDRKEGEVLLEADNRERERFIRLSDREKRALAAERRLLDQVATSGGHTPVLCRCWQCGEDITGKVPFEYYDCKFCTTKCLRAHRSQTAQRH